MSDLDDAVEWAANYAREQREYDEAIKAQYPKGTKVYGGKGLKRKCCVTTGRFMRCGIEDCGCLNIEAVWPAGTARKRALTVQLAPEGLEFGRGPKKQDWGII